VVATTAEAIVDVIAGAGVATATSVADAELWTVLVEPALVGVGLGPS